MHAFYMLIMHLDTNIKENFLLKKRCTDIYRLSLYIIYFKIK